MKIAWYLVGTRRTGSSRMECFHIHDLMTRRSPGSSIVRWSPEEHASTTGLSPTQELSYLKAAGIDLVVFQKLSDDVSRELARLCRQHGIATVFVLCDYRGDLSMVPLCSATIVTSSNLRDLITAEHPDCDVTFCQYGVETPGDITPAYARSGSSTVTLVYLGNLRLSRAFGFLSRISGTTLRTIGPFSHYDRRLNASRFLRLRTELAWRVGRAHPDAGTQSEFATRPLPTVHPWHPDAVSEDLASADIGVIPIEPEQIQSVSGRMKSNSRVLSMWGAGLAVVASPLRSYTETITHGADGFIAESRAEWTQLVTRLRDDADLRREVGRRGRARAFDAFGLDRQFREYQEVFGRVVARPHPVTVENT